MGDASTRAEKEALVVKPPRGWRRVEEATYPEPFDRRCLVPRDCLTMAGDPEQSGIARKAG